MATRYEALNTNITKTIQQHLLKSDALPPTTEASRLAVEITDVVFADLNGAGITKEVMEQLWNKAPAKKAQAGS